jgi:diadenosine tetraphosphate (Ap4A) HIT family hydrolase
MTDEFGNTEREIRLVAIAAHARGDFVAERIALDRLALMERDVTRQGEHMSDCPFCFANWDNLDILQRVADVAVLNPLDPVTDGHVLAIHRKHTADAAFDPEVASDLMFSAALWVQRRGIEANIITSIGANATQTVRHTHLHVVPRRLNDDLPLPWTPQQMEREQWRRALAMKPTLSEIGKAPPG